MSTITRTTIAREIREQRDILITLEHDRRRSARAWGREVLPMRPRPVVNAEARENALNNIMPAYGWPGGYAVAYYIEGEYDLTGDVLCGECARTFLLEWHGDDRAMSDEPKVCAESTDGYEGNDSADHLYCDECHTVIARAWCRDKGHRDDRDLPAGVWARLRLEEMHGEGDTWTKHSRAGHRRSFIRPTRWGVYRPTFTDRRVRDARELHRARPGLTRYGGRRAAA